MAPPPAIRAEVARGELYRKNNKRSDKWAILGALSGGVLCTIWIVEIKFGLYSVDN
jgi:hypothetical protein